MLAVYLIQALMLAGLGIVFGLVLGALTPALLSATYGDALPIALAVEPHPLSLLTAAGAGLLTMLLFVLLPLGRASVVPPAVLMRSHLTDEQERPPLGFIVTAAASGLALLRARHRGVGGARHHRLHLRRHRRQAFVLLLGFGWLLQKLAARFRRTKPPSLALALASIAGPGSIARQVAVSLGLGLGFLVAIALIDRSLMAEFAGQHSRSTLPPITSSTSTRKDLAAFRDTAKRRRAQRQARRRAHAARPHRRHQRRSGGEGRGRSRQPLGARERPRPHLHRHASAKARPSREGKWWEPGYTGPPLVSFDADSGPGLGLEDRRHHHGQRARPQCRGASIANFRKIDWESLAINFVMVFSPNTLTGAPHRVLVTLEYPKGTDSAREAKLIQALADRFPLVTAIKVGDIVEAAKDLLQKVMTAIRMTAGVTLLIGALVLAGAVAATQQRRKYQAVLYKTLGATRGRIVRAELLEFGLLGVAVAAFAACRRHDHRLGAVQMGLRGAVRLLRPRRRRNRAACARAGAGGGRRRHLAGAVGQGRALFARRIRLVVNVA